SHGPVPCAHPIRIDPAMSDFEHRDPIEEPRPGMSTIAKVFIALTVLSFISLLLCCGGVYWFARNSVNITHQPQEIQRIRERIMSINLPEQYQPRGGVSLNLWLKMDMAVYTRGNEQNDGGVALMQMSTPGQQSNEELKQAFEQQQ